MMRDFGESEQLRFSIKGNQDYVSQTDLRAEETLCYKLNKARPQFDILAEERGYQEATEPDELGRRWIIDPLDGTRNFLHGFPFFAISIAAAEKDEITAGVIYAPFYNEMFVAEKNQGAYLNDKRIRVSNISAISKSLLAYGRLGSLRDKFFSIMRKGPHTRQLGSVSLALAWTAAARLDGFITGEAEIWDIAAGAIIAQEAGAIITKPDGKKVVFGKTGSAITAANSLLHRKLVS